MPLLFVGHGSPLNALEDTSFSKTWEKLGTILPKPKAILAISAHYAREGNFVNGEQNPRQIYDMYGFPEALYRIKYHPQGDPALAARVSALTGAHRDASFGIDHGIWSVLRRMYPEADVPVVTMSVNMALKASSLFALGAKLAPLRQEGVLLFGTGSIVHNLALVNWDMATGYPWAQRFQKNINEAILAHDYDKVIHYEKEPEARKAFLTAEHFAPLLYLLGAAEADDKVAIFNDQETLGSISMTGYLFKSQK